MQLPFFYEEIIPEGEERFEVSKETSKHVIQVLRKRIGAQIIITNGKGLALTVELKNEDKKRALVEVVNRELHHLPPHQNAIAVGLIKNQNRFEWFLEKAAELGIKRIYPLITERSERKSIRMDRTRMVLVSAMIQSRQYFLPEMSEPVPLADAIKNSLFDQKFIAHCLPAPDKKNLEDLVVKGQSNIVLIGPEGDFTEGEIDFCLSEGYQPVSLGETRLRTETAALKAAVYLS